jgi:hypothetical protein
LSTALCRVMHITSNTSTAAKCCNEKAPSKDAER